MAQPLIFGEVLFDQFHDGSVVLGGAPFNVAWHLQAFGQSPLFVSRIGNDRLGDKIIHAMQDWGMDLSGLQRDDEHETGTVQVQFHGGEPSYDIVADRAYDFIDAGTLPKHTDVSVLYHGSLALRNPVSRAALQKLKQNHPVPIFIDINLRSPWWDRDEVLDLLQDADWLKLNHDELEQLSSHPKAIDEGVEELMQTHDLELVVVTRGKQGAMAFSRTGETLEIVPREKLDIVDTVGAGDAFASVLILGMAHNWTMPVTLERAQAFASAVVGVRGATIHDPEFYQPFLTSWQMDNHE